MDGTTSSPAALVRWIGVTSALALGCTAALGCAATGDFGPGAPTYRGKAETPNDQSADDTAEALADAHRVLTTDDRGEPDATGIAAATLQMLYAEGRLTIADSGQEVSEDKYADLMDALEHQRAIPVPIPHDIQAAVDDYLADVLADVDRPAGIQLVAFGAETGALPTPATEPLPLVITMSLLTRDTTITTEIPAAILPFHDDRHLMVIAGMATRIIEGLKKLAPDVRASRQAKLKAGRPNRTTDRQGAGRMSERSKTFGNNKAWHERKRLPD